MRLLLEAILLFLGGERCGFLAAGAGTLFGIPLLLSLLIPLVVPMVLTGALHPLWLDGRGRWLKAHGERTGGSQKLRRAHQHHGLHEAQSPAQIHMKGQRHRIAGDGGARDVPAGLFTEGIVEGDHYRGCSVRQQSRQMIEDGVE